MMTVERDWVDQIAGEELGSGNMKVRYLILLVLALLVFSSCVQPPAERVTPPPAEEAKPGVETAMPLPSSSSVPTPAPTPSPTPMPESTPSKVTDKLIITILYDNNDYDERLETAWGFSCLVKGLEKTILFDTGGDSSMLLSNMAKLAIDARDVDVIMVSHIHQDHLGGLAGFLKKNSQVTVYLPEHFPDSIKSIVRQSGAKLIDVHEVLEICKNAYSTGELGTWIKEQSLIIESAEGLVVITGCAHPGVVNVVREAKKLLKSDVHLVLGGFHLCWMNAFQIRSIVDDVREQGVERVAPCHCSGDLARNSFEKTYGTNFIKVGVGSRLEIER